MPAAELQVATPPAAPAATPTAAAGTSSEQKPTADMVHTRDAHMHNISFLLVDLGLSLRREIYVLGSRPKQLFEGFEVTITHFCQQFPL